MRFLLADVYDSMIVMLAVTPCSGLFCFHRTVWTFLYIFPVNYQTTDRPNGLITDRLILYNISGAC